MSGIDLSHIDTSVRPCDDFFRFATGKWIERTEIPAEEPVWGGFIEVRDHNLDVLRRIADEASRATAPKGTIEQKVGDYWASGMDEDAIEAAGTSPLEPELALIAGLTDRAQLPTVLARLGRGRSSAGVGLAVRQDPGDSTKNILWFQQGGLGMPDRDYYLKDDPRSREIRVRYVGHVARQLGHLGDGEDEARYGAATVLTIETRLALASMTRVEQRDPYKTYNRMTVAQLAERAPGFDWRAFLDTAGAHVDELNVRQPAFFTELAQAFSDVPL
ncbi:MAG TPA: M13 family metallopeptidase N-terminal domain-containing protein, partial [Candidatus Limnocylindria bacterium]